MFGFPARILLTLTALSPVLFTYAWTLWDDDRELSILLALGGLFLAFVCISLIASARADLEEVNVKIESAEAADRENIAFLLLYISPLFTGTLYDLNWDVWIPVLVVFAAVIATGYNYHFSPLLGLFGWHAYRIGTSGGITYVLLTKRKLRQAVDVIRVRQLTEYVLIEFRK